MGQWCVWDLAMAMAGYTIGINGNSFLQMFMMALLIGGRQFQQFLVRTHGARSPSIASAR